MSLEEDGHARPAIVVEDMPAGKTVTRRFPVLFTTAGEHEIAARLQSDAVTADNARSLVIDVPKAVDVLVIDGDADGAGRVLSDHGAGAGRQDHERPAAR